MALTARQHSIDAGGLVPDIAPTNSWSDKVHEVDPLELLEVQLCNVTAPFILVSRLRDAMRRSEHPRRYVVNVSAMEGIFKRGYKVYEVPISYDGRGYEEGKKITWRDGVVALWVLLKYRFTE